MSHLKTDNGLSFIREWRRFSKGEGPPPVEVSTDCAHTQVLLRYAQEYYDLQEYMSGSPQAIVGGPKLRANNRKLPFDQLLRPDPSYLAGIIHEVFGLTDGLCDNLFVGPQPLVLVPARKCILDPNVAFFDSVRLDKRQNFLAAVREYGQSNATGSRFTSSSGTSLGIPNLLFAVLLRAEELGHLLHCVRGTLPTSDLGPEQIDRNVASWRRDCVLWPNTLGYAPESADMGVVRANGVEQFDTYLPEFHSVPPDQSVIALPIAAPSSKLGGPIGASLVLKGYFGSFFTKEGTHRPTYQEVVVGYLLDTLFGESWPDSTALTSYGRKLTP